jgi:hypothetical protein
MRSLNSPITKRRRSVTNRNRPIPFGQQSRNLTPLHFQILHWIEGRAPGDARPKIEGLSGFALDTTVAELVLLDLIKAVSIPQSRYDRGHWEPTGLTGKGWRTLLRHRRRKPQPVAHHWSRLEIWS